MATILVETFEQVETQSDHSHPEVSSEAVALIDALGLEGQQKLLSATTTSEDRVLSPYREMTADERFTYSKLCPSVVKLSEYAAGPVPLRVLQVASHATSLGIYKHLEVWYASSAAIKDPVLVGVLTDAAWNAAPHYLARWGEVLDEFPALHRKALQLHHREVLDKLREIEQDIKAQLSKVQNTSTDSSVVQSWRMPSAYLN